MKNFLLIAIVVSLCDSCNSKSFEKSKFRTVGVIDERDASPEYESSYFNSRDSLPEFEQPLPRIKSSGFGNEQDGKTPARNFIYIYPLD